MSGVHVVDRTSREGQSKRSRGAAIAPGTRRGATPPVRVESVTSPPCYRGASTARSNNLPLDGGTCLGLRLFDDLVRYYLSVSAVRPVESPMRRLATVLRSVFARLARPDDGADPACQVDEILRSTSPASARAELDTPPEEIVCRLLHREGGRLRQRDVAELTGWSESAVSRLLTRMEAEDRVCRVKVGREKVVGLPSRMPASPTGTTTRGGRDDRTASATAP